MHAKNLSHSVSEVPTRPFNARPASPFEAVAPVRTHLMLVRTPKPSPRGLAWARRGGTRPFDGTGLTSMLRFERLNLG